jgi:HSP20 family molecular chaperone IbpA
MNNVSSSTFKSANGGPSSDKPRLRRVAAPDVDVFENADEVLVVADIPGVSGDVVDVRVENDTLTLAAKHPTPVDGAPALAREYEEVDYARSFRIPAGIDTANVRAEAKNGTLRVHLPKASAAKPKKIAVQSA